MGQAASITLSDKSDIICDSEDFSRRFNKMALSTIKVPMVIVAFPLLNAYKFREHEFTGVKVIDGTIGGLLGVVGWPLSPFVAFWSAYQSMFIEGPSKSTEITEETKMQVRRAMGMDCDRFYNVAIVGAAGTGKSSLVNGILGYQDNDEYAASINETEKIIEPRGYRHHDMRSLVLWDMPGAGTTSCNEATYFEDYYLKAFDSLIIVTAERLQRIDLDIATKAQQYRIPVLIVRNRCDLSIDAKMSRYKKDPKTNSDTAWAKAVGDLVREVRQRVFKELRQHKINTKRLFLLSAWSLRNLMSSVKHPEFIKGNERVIDELRFMQALMDAVLEKRRRLVRKHRSGTSSSNNLLAHQGSFQNVMVQP